MTFNSRPCPCGSGHASAWQYDARGIPLARTCDACHEEKMAKYRPEVLTDSQYDADEDIDGDDWHERAQDEMESRLYWHGR